MNAGLEHWLHAYGINPAHVQRHKRKRNGDIVVHLTNGATLTGPAEVISKKKGE